MIWADATPARRALLTFMTLGMILYFALSWGVPHARIGRGVGLAVWFASLVALTVISVRERRARKVAP